jgi:hypothetical protein
MDCANMHDLTREAFGLAVCVGADDQWIRRCPSRLTSDTLPDMALREQRTRAVLPDLALSGREKKPIPEPLFHTPVSPHQIWGAGDAKSVQIGPFDRGGAQQTRLRASRHRMCSCRSNF